jgi:hypothetical protein
LISVQAESDGCPRISHDGDTTTASGDCDDPAGGRWEGTVVAVHDANHGRKLAGLPRDGRTPGS